MLGFHSAFGFAYRLVGVVFESELITNQFHNRVLLSLVIHFSLFLVQLYSYSIRANLLQTCKSSSRL